MKIAQNTVVTLDYTLKVDGSLVESTDGDEPMTYLHGHENIVPGLEKALVGLVVGDTKRVLVQPRHVLW
jgi:FKBP-type peptidyl-prolyl cis-trans isomerase SlyD